MTSRSPKGKRNAKTVNQEVVKGKISALPRETREYLGFGFWKNSKEWKCKPLNSRKARLYKKCKEKLLRKRAVARPLGVTIKQEKQGCRRNR